MWSSRSGKSEHWHIDENELKWTRMDEFNSDDHFIYYCAQEFLRRNWVALIVNQRVWNSVVGCNLKNDRMISVHFQGKPFNITVIQVYAPTTNVKDEVEKMILWRSTRPSRTNTKKRCPFHHGDWNAKVGGQEIPGVTGKFGLGVQHEAVQRLTEFCQETALVVANTLFQQHKRWLYTWTSWSVPKSDLLITFFAAKDGEALYSQQKQDWELTVAQSMNSWLLNSDLNWRK